MYDFCLKVLTVHVNELSLFWAKAFPAVETTLFVFGYDEDWDKNQISVLSYDERILQALVSYLFVEIVFSTVGMEICKLKQFIF